jgi:hypothetical protein
MMRSDGGDGSKSCFRRDTCINGEGDMTDEKERKKVPVLLWPFYAIWRLVAFILEFTGRVLGVVLGLVLLIVGLLVSLTVIGAVVGVPLMILGLLLILRGLF